MIKQKIEYNLKLPKKVKERKRRSAAKKTGRYRPTRAAQ
jgi:hypothetical protein